MKEIGRKIKSLREAKGITLKDMAAIFKVGLTTYSSRENRGDFSDEDVTKILKKIGISRQQFEEYKTPNSELVMSLPESLISIEAKNDVILSALAELLAKQNGQSVIGSLNELTRAVKEKYEERRAELLK